MTNKEIMDLLVKIEFGCIPTESEMRQLKSIKSFKWQHVNVLPRSFVLLSGLLELDLSGVDVSDYSILSYLINLRSLDLSNNKNLIDISFLSNLKKLKTISLSGTSVSDITPLLALPKITLLDISFTQVEDISALARKKGISNLILKSSKVTDFSSLFDMDSLENLDLSNNQNLTDINKISALKNLKSLDLSKTKVSDVRELSKLTKLTSLKLQNTFVYDISPLSELRDLVSLDLEGIKIKDISPLSELKKITDLNLNATDVEEIWSLVASTELTKLSLAGTHVRDLSVISEMDSLTHLDLRGVDINEISVLSGLNKLRTLYLGGISVQNNLKDISALKELNSLEVLDLSYSSVEDISALAELKSLRKVSLKGTNVSDINHLSNLTSLIYIDLSLTFVKDINVLSNLTNIEKLSLSNTPVEDISSLSNLSKLTFLDLRCMTINSIPESFLRLGLDFVSTDNVQWPGIYIYGLNIKEQPIGIFRQRRELIEAYFESSHLAEPINECKVVFLGDGGVGKSLIIDRLMRDGEYSYDFNGESTPGIKITSKKYYIENETIELHFWDFGGQAIMHSMHRLFLTHRTLYVVIVNARDNKANEQAWYWIRNIRSFANGAPIFMLVNQIDQNPTVDINEIGIKKEYPNLKEVKFVSALKDSPVQFNKSVRDVISRIVSKMESVHTLFPKSWLSLMNDLQEMPMDYIDYKSFYLRCKRNGVDTSQEILDQIINWYQDLGICFYSKAHPASRQYMVLKPRWLLNALYIISFNGRKYAKNGIIHENNIYNLICEPVSKHDIKKVWAEIEYESFEIQYIINVLLNYRLVYRLDSEYFFIPMLCNENEPDLIEIFDSENVRRVYFKYTYLPENVLHQLMVLHGDELDTNIVWKTGAVFERKRCGWQALVRIKDNCLDVYAKASDQVNHPINSYLDLLRESIYRINTDLGIEATEYIVYTKNGKSDHFKYRILEGSKKAGQHTIYSDVFDSLIDINDIIGVIKSFDLLSGGVKDNQLPLLLNVLASIFLQLQKNKMYYDAKEDECNTYVRDLLERSRYICKDQTFQGTSPVGISSGRLDILIQDRDRGNDIAIYEGLKLKQKKFGDGDRRYLSKHLQKLMYNYNPTGLDNLLLVSYVSWDRESFDSLVTEYGKYVMNGEEAPYRVVESSKVNFDAGFLACYKMGYECGRNLMNVYHFIVRVAP